jgi:hypothetical protein
VFPSFTGKDGGTVKYLKWKDSGCRLYIPPMVTPILGNAIIPVLGTEGEKKALKAVQVRTEVTQLV